MKPHEYPDKWGRFGQFGGKYAPEILMPALEELEKHYLSLQADPSFRKELDGHLRDFVGRPSPLYFAERLTRHCGGAKIYLKREDLNHTGAHKINNSLGQALVARHMGKKRVIAETGAGQHGVATATVAAKFDMECVIYMGRVDMERQAPNVQRMELLGATVVPVESGSRTLKDAINEAIRDWVTRIDDTHYVFGSALGPHPYPRIVRDFQKVIGEETERQILELEGRLPDHLIACVGGGSNAIGLFWNFLDRPEVGMTGVEAGGEGVATGRHAARFAGGSLGVLHGARTYILQTPHGQIAETHSVSAGLDYAGVGPEHALYRDMGRIKYTSATDVEALDAFHLLCRLEGVIPALESAHAVVEAVKLAPTLAPDRIIVVNLSGRGDKDMATVFEAMASAKAGKGREAVNRVDAAFARLRAGKQKAFIPYLAAGVPGPDETVELILELEKLGADIVELGYPFSDPMADGVVNQTAANRALSLGVDAEVYFSIVEKIRQKSQIPLLVFSYLNPVHKIGLDAFARRAKAAGMDGLLLVDMPVEESGELEAVCRREELCLIFLAAPTTTPERLEKVVRAGTGFLYYISRTGITGEREAFPADFAAKLTAVKAASRLPVAVGFGISTPEQVRTVCGLADGVVVGSGLVRRTLEPKPFPDMLREFKAFAGPLIAPTKEAWISMDLDGWRARIDALNAQLVDLLNERARCALEIVALKRSQGLPVHDPKREEEVLDKVVRHNRGPLSEEALRGIFRCIMAEHRKLEEDHGQAGNGQ